MVGQSARRRDVDIYIDNMVSIDKPMDRQLGLKCANRLMMYCANVTTMAGILVVTSIQSQRGFLRELRQFEG